MARYRPRNLPISAAQTRHALDLMAPDDRYHGPDPAAPTPTPRAPRAASRQTPERDILAAIRVYLRQRHVTHWRVPTTGQVSSHTASGFQHNPARGMPDLLCILGGQFLGIEVKTATGRLRPAQVAFRDAVHHAGGLYLVARSVDDVQRLLDEEWETMAEARGATSRPRPPHTDPPAERA